MTFKLYIYLKKLTPWKYWVKNIESSIHEDGLSLGYLHLLSFLNQSSVAFRICILDYFVRYIIRTDSGLCQQINLLVDSLWLLSQVYNRL